MDRTDALIRHFQFTGSASYGKSGMELFMEKEVTKLSLVIDAEFDIRDIIQNWKTATPVKFNTSHQWFSV